MKTANTTVKTRVSNAQMSSKALLEKLRDLRLRATETKATKYTMDKACASPPFKPLRANLLRAGYLGLFPRSMRIIIRPKSRAMDPRRIKRVRLPMFKSKMLDSKPKILNF